MKNKIQISKCKKQIKSKKQNQKFQTKIVLNFKNFCLSFI
jgi:hypothetical protein